jgi:hypothetical protein
MCQAEGRENARPTSSSPIRRIPSYVVGGTVEIAEPETVGYRLSTLGFGSPERMMLLTEIRLFANASTPTYHVVVGDVFGKEQVAAMLRKLGQSLSG